MAQLVVRNIEAEVKSRLQRRASQVARTSAVRGPRGFSSDAFSIT